MTGVRRPASAGTHLGSAELCLQAIEKVVEALVRARQILDETALCHDAALYAYGACDSTPRGVSGRGGAHETEIRDGDQSEALQFDRAQPARREHVSG